MVFVDAGMMAKPPVSTHGGIQRGLPEHRRDAPTCRWAEAAASLSGTTARRSPRGACLLEQARSYLETFCFELEKPGKYWTSRLDEIESEIERTGGYQQTYEELAFGAKLAWRNHARCIGRLYWRSLEVLDCRQVTSMREAAARLEDHLRFAFNEGSIRSTISIFPARTNRDSPILIHNPQLLRYAGYPGASGRTLGDPQNLAITAKAMSLGWRPTGQTPFDILPIILQKGDEYLLHPLPKDCCREVSIEHPEWAWFKELGLRWHALPVITDMTLEVGGIEYPCAPFNGFYMGTEIGCRNLADKQRYDVLPQIGERMGLDLTDDSTLWKDRALLELNVAVLHSFKRDGVRIIDHHEASRHFMMHMAREAANHRAVPAEWAWIVPPMSGSTTEVFHTDMNHFDASPRFIRRVHLETAGDR